MAAASYDQLLKQVEILKMENSNLRQELEDNSNHLTKLETEASNMKVKGRKPIFDYLLRTHVCSLWHTVAKHFAM